MSNASRDNGGKPKLSYNSLGLEVQEGEARVWEAGAKKYARGNWLKGTKWSEAADSLRRHLDKFLAGMDLDVDEKGEASEGYTGLPHVDHIVCCAKILSNSYHTRKDLDDRGGMLTISGYKIPERVSIDTNFKVGDKVKIVTLDELTEGLCNIKVGDTGVIKEVDGNTVRIGGYWMYKTSVEHV